MRRSRRGLGLGCVAVALAAGLTGCVGAGLSPAAQPPSASAASAPPVSAPAPSAVPPTEGEPASPAAMPAGCESVLTQAGVEDLASDNLVPREAVVQPWDYGQLRDVAREGVLCKWGNQGDVFVVLGQLPMSETDWESTRQSLLAQGFVADDSHGVPGFLNGPDTDDESYVNRGFTWRDGILYYASYPGIFEFVAAFAA